jgi:hypothetical protein
MDDLIKRGQEYYDRYLKNTLEPDKVGSFVAIEPESGQFFVGQTGSAALVAARTAIPDHLFYLVRIGYKTADRICKVKLCGVV